jgi:hypothetical protein
MAKLEKSLKREKKQHKARHGMRVSGYSVKVIQSILTNRGGSHG